MSSEADKQAGRDASKGNGGGWRSRESFWGRDPNDPEELPSDADIIAWLANPVRQYQAGEMSKATRLFFVRGRRDRQKRA